MVVNLHACMFGYTVAWSGATLTSIIKATGACAARDLDDESVCPTGALMASVSPLAAMVSSLAAGWVADVYGRRVVLNYTAGLWIAGYATLALSMHVASVLAGRAISGVAVGSVSAVVPVYISETSRADMRGKLGGMFNVAVSSGILLLFGLELIDKSGNWWRVMAAVGMTPPLLFLCVALRTNLLPETPRWLALNGNAFEARMAASKLGKGYETALLDDANDKVLVDSRDGRTRALVLGMGTVTCSVLSYNSTIQGYLDVILAHSGVSNVTSGGALFALTQLIFALLMMVVIIERVGRRPLLIASPSGACLSLLAMARASRHKSGVLTVFFSCSFIASVTLGLSTLSMVYASEVFPDRIRGRVMSISCFIFWGASFVLVETFVPLSRFITIPCVLDLFAVLCALSATFFFVFAIETKDASLSQIQREFQKVDQRKEARSDSHMVEKGSSSSHRTSEYTSLLSPVSPNPTR